MTTTIRILLLFAWFLVAKLLSDKVANLEGKHYRANITYWFAAGMFFVGQLYGMFLCH